LYSLQKEFFQVRLRNKQTLHVLTLLSVVLSLSLRVWVNPPTSYLPCLCMTLLEMTSEAETLMMSFKSLVVEGLITLQCPAG